MIALMVSCKYFKYLSQVRVRLSLVIQVKTSTVYSKFLGESKMKKVYVLIASALLAYAPNVFSLDNSPTPSQTTEPRGQLDSDRYGRDIAGRSNSSTRNRGVVSGSEMPENPQNKAPDQNSGVTSQGGTAPNSGINSPGGVNSGGPGGGAAGH